MKLNDANSEATTDKGKGATMGILKKLVVFVLATIAAVYLILWSLDAFGFRSPVFAFLLNWLAMAWVAIVGQAVYFSLPQSYYHIKSFERTGQVYEQLGVRLFKRLVRRGPLALFSPTLRFPKERTISALQQLEGEMRKAETGHVYIFVLMLLFISAALLRDGCTGDGRAVLAWNVGKLEASPAARQSVSGSTARPAKARRSSIASARRV